MDILISEKEKKKESEEVSKRVNTEPPPVESEGAF